MRSARAGRGAFRWRTEPCCSGSRSRRRTGSSTTSGRCSHSDPAGGSRRTPCSSWTAPWSPPATTLWPSGRRTTGTPPTTRSSSTPTPAWSSWPAGPLAGNRNDCKAWEESGAKSAVGKTTTIADGGLPGHWTRHPAPPQARPGRTPGLERGTQQGPQAGPSLRRARLRPHEDLEDPPRLPPQRRRRPPRHAGIARMHNLALTG